MMKQVVHFFIQSTAATMSTGSIWLVSFFPLDQTFLLSSAYALGGGTAVFFSTKALTHQHFLKQNQLSRKEYAYIKRHLKEADQKIKRLRKALFSIRTISTIKQNIEMYRVVNRIYTITKKEPKRFYLAESFYYSHLDSLVELSEKYAFLAGQPSKTSELSQSLTETRRTISQLSDSLEQDLHDVLSKDISQLNFELDVAKLTIDKTVKK